MPEGIIKFNFSTACDLTNKLTACMDTLEIENEKLQLNFTSLSDSFKDAFYDEFKVEFDKGDRAIKAIKEDVMSLTKSLVDYAIKLGELERANLGGGY